MTFFAWPVLGLIWLLDRLWERWRARQSLPPPRPVVHRARLLTNIERQHRQALATVQRQRNDRVREALHIIAIRRSMDADTVPVPQQVITRWSEAAAIADIGAASAAMDPIDAAYWRDRFLLVHHQYQIQPQPTIRDVEQRGDTMYATVVFRVLKLSPMGAICVPVAATAAQQVIVVGEHRHCPPTVPSTEAQP